MKNKKEIKEKLEDIGRKIEDMYKKRELDLIKGQVLRWEDYRPPCRRSRH